MAVYPFAPPSIVVAEGVDDTAIRDFRNDVSASNLLRQAHFVDRGYEGYGADEPIPHGAIVNAIPAEKRLARSWHAKHVRSEVCLGVGGRPCAGLPTEPLRLGGDASNVARFFTSQQHANTVVAQGKSVCAECARTTQNAQRCCGGTRLANRVATNRPLGCVGVIGLPDVERIDDVPMGVVLPPSRKLDMCTQCERLAERAARQKKGARFTTYVTVNGAREHIEYVRSLEMASKRPKDNARGPMWSAAVVPNEWSETLVEMAWRAFHVICPGCGWHVARDDIASSGDRTLRQGTRWHKTCERTLAKWFEDRHAEAGRRMLFKTRADAVDAAAKALIHAASDANTLPAVSSENEPQLHPWSPAYPSTVGPQLPVAASGTSNRGVAIFCRRSAGGFGDMHRHQWSVNDAAYLHRKLTAFGGTLTPMIPGHPGALVILNELFAKIGKLTTSVWVQASVTHYRKVYQTKYWAPSWPELVRAANDLMDEKQVGGDRVMRHFVVLIDEPASLCGAWVGLQGALEPFKCPSRVWIAVKDAPIVDVDTDVGDALAPIVFRVADMLATLRDRVPVTNAHIDRFLVSAMSAVRAPHRGTRNQRTATFAARLAADGVESQNVLPSQTEITVTVNTRTMRDKDFKSPDDTTEVPIWLTNGAEAAIQARRGAYARCKREVFDEEVVRAAANYFPTRVGRDEGKLELTARDLNPPAAPAVDADFEMTDAFPDTTDEPMSEDFTAEDANDEAPNDTLTEMVEEYDAPSLHVPVPEYPECTAADKTKFVKAIRKYFEDARVTSAAGASVSPEQLSDETIVAAFEQTFARVRAGDDG